VDLGANPTTLRCNFSPWVNAQTVSGAGERDLGVTRHGAHRRAPAIPVTDVPEGVDEADARSPASAAEAEDSPARRTSRTTSRRRGRRWRRRRGTLPSSRPWASSLTPTNARRRSLWVSPVPLSSPIDFMVLFPCLCFGLITNVVCSGLVCNPDRLRREEGDSRLELRQAASSAAADDSVGGPVEHAGGDLT
jgi:hypothetical protein